MAIAIVGMLDEREEALRVIRDRIGQRGHETCLIDISVGTGGIVPTLVPDVGWRELAQLAEAPPSWPQDSKRRYATCTRAATFKE
jgi:uncharacterized protein (UPF0261 family)